MTFGRKKACGPFLLAVALAGLLWPPAASAQFSNCQQLLSSRNLDEYICPPPQGDMRMDLMGKFVCGPGQCATQSDGKIKCSSEPGGLAVIGQDGKAKCVGGCVDGGPNYCQTPVP